MSLYLSAERQKSIQIDRQQRQRISTHAKLLEKIISLIDKIKIEADISKVEVEIEKLNEFKVKEQELKEKHE